MLFGTRFQFINQWTWQNQAKHCFTRCGNKYSVKLLRSNKLSKIPEITVWHFEWLCSPHWNFVAQNMWFATITKFSRVKLQNLEICAKIYSIWSIHHVLEYLFQLTLWRHIAIAHFIALFTIHPHSSGKNFNHASHDNAVWKSAYSNMTCTDVGGYESTFPINLPNPSPRRI